MPTSSGVLPGKALRTQMQAWEDNERGAEPSARHGDADVPNTGSDGRIEPWSSSPMPSGQHRCATQLRPLSQSKITPHT